MEVEKHVVDVSDLPNDLERELLNNLVEEASEVIQRCTKMLRFGKDEIGPRNDKNNRVLLSEETGQLLKMIDLALAHKLMIVESVRDGVESKYRGLLKYSQCGLH